MIMTKNIVIDNLNKDDIVPIFKMRIEGIDGSTYVYNTCLNIEITEVGSAIYAKKFSYTFYMGMISGVRVPRLYSNTLDVDAESFGFIYDDDSKYITFYKKAVRNYGKLYIKLEAPHVEVMSLIDILPPTLSNDVNFTKAMFFEPQSKSCFMNNGSTMTLRLPGIEDSANRKWLIEIKSYSYTSTGTITIQYMMGMIHYGSTPSLKPFYDINTLQEQDSFTITLDESNNTLSITPKGSQYRMVVVDIHQETTLHDNVY